jgi:hypothetical protein
MSVHIRITHAHRLTRWVQLLWGCVGAACFMVAGAALMNDQYVGCALIAIVGAGALYLLAKPPADTHAARRTIEPGEYPVHMMRLLGDEVIVVAGVWNDSIHDPQLSLYLLARHCFGGDLRPFLTKTGVVMTVRMTDSGPKIALSRARAGFRVVTSDTQYDPTN